MIKWISYFFTGAWDILLLAMIVFGIIFIICLPIMTVVLFTFKAFTGEIIVDGQFTAVPEMIVFLIYFSAACISHGKNISRRDG